MYEVQNRITYYDLDFNAGMKLSSIIKMVHIAADVNANELGIGFRTLSPLNMSFVIQRFGLKVTQMPMYDDVVTVRTWPAEMARGTFIRKGDMYDKNCNKLMEWASLWILFDIESRKILKPSALPVAVPTITNIPVDISPNKVVLPPNIQNTSQHIHTVRYADVDTNMHMNNAIYGDVISNAAYNILDKASPKWQEIQINFLGETKFGDEIDVTAYENAGTFYVKGNANEQPSFLAQIKT